jgi:hypothetical protein
VDNFLAKIFFNEINAQPPKSWKSNVFIDFLWITPLRCGQNFFRLGAESPISADRMGQHPAPSGTGNDAL